MNPNAEPVPPVEQLDDGWPVLLSFEDPLANVPIERLGFHLADEEAA
jgi:hypothetical protein